MLELLSRALLQSVKDKKNVVFSPISLQFVMSMLYHASAGAEQQSIKESCLGLDLSAEAIGKLNNLPMTFFNGVWYQVNEINLKPEYVQLLSSFFEAKAKAVNFKQDFAAIAYEINSLVLEKTDGMIAEAVKADELSNLFVCFLNTTLLKAEWVYEFDAGLNIQDTFNGYEPIEVEFMTKKADFEYRQTDYFQSILFPRKDGGEVQIVLPALNVSLEYLLSEIEYLVSIDHYDNEVEVVMPKLQIAGETNCGELLGIDQVTLEALGIYNCPISIKQVAKIELDEKGVKAAAATVAMVTRGMSRSKIMRVDRPFILLIKEKDGTVSFAATVVDPTK